MTLSMIEIIIYNLSMIEIIIYNIIFYQDTCLDLHFHFHNVL